MGSLRAIAQAFKEGWESAPDPHAWSYRIGVVLGALIAVAAAGLVCGAAIVIVLAVAQAVGLF